MNILFPLAITLSIETGIYMILKHRDMRLFIVVSVLNLILNMGMNFYLSSVSDEFQYWLFLSIFEVLTVVVETLVIFAIFQFKFWKVLLISFIANASSFGIGMALIPLYETKITIIVICSLFFFVFLFSFGFVLFVNLRKRS